MDPGILELFTGSDSSLVDQVSVPCGTKGELRGELRRLARASDSGWTVDEADRVDIKSFDAYGKGESQARERQGKDLPYRFPEQTVVPALVVMLTYKRNIRCDTTRSHRGLPSLLVSFEQQSLEP
jgi:hypothetical protein